MTFDERKCLTELEDFAEYVAKAVLNSHELDGNFEENAEFWAEMFCRKLWKLGYVEVQGDNWVLGGNVPQSHEKPL